MAIKELVIFLLLITAVSAAGIQNSFTAEGNGAISRSVMNSWDSGSSDIGVGGNSASQILTSNGQFQYQTRDTTDARVNNRYNETGYMRVEGTSILSESLAMHETDLGQSADVTHSGIVNNAEFDTAKFVSDANLSIGQKGGWQGSGMYSRDLNYGVDIVQNSGSLGDSGIDYGAHGGERSTIITNSSGYVQNIRPEFSFSDFSDGFFINKTTISEFVINTTEPSNLTNETQNIKATNETEEHS
jgi:hypothetical protein